MLPSSLNWQKLMADIKSRQIKAKKIISILHDVWPHCLHKFRCLDLGCGVGIIASHLAQQVSSVVALDSDWDILSQAPSGLARLQGDGLRLPFGNATFDLVVCAQVYEHVQDPVQLVEEIIRVLKPGGACYFSGPNRLWPYEYHYRVWFAHWLPRRWLRKVLKCLGCDCSAEVTLYTYKQLRRLWKDMILLDYTVRLIHEPERFPGANAPKWVRYIPYLLISKLAFVMPNFNWILLKPIDNK